MTIYFDEVRRRVMAITHEHTEQASWLRALARIEAVVIHDVRVVAADRDVPFAVRREIANHIGAHAVEGIGREANADRAWAARASHLAEALHTTFRQLGKAGHKTRFGVLSDCPVDIAAKIRTHDHQHGGDLGSNVVGSNGSGLVAETLARATAELGELRVQLKQHDDASSAHYDEDHARKLRSEIQGLETLVANLTATTTPKETTP